MYETVEGIDLYHCFFSHIAAFIGSLVFEAELLYSCLG